MTIKVRYNLFFFLLLFLPLYVFRYGGFDLEQLELDNVEFFIKFALFPISLVSLFLLQKNTIKEIFLFLIFFSLVTLISIKSNDLRFFNLFLLILVSKGIDFNSFFKVLFWVSLVSLIFILLIFIINYYFYQVDTIIRESDNVVRYFVGQSHPNSFSAKVFIFMVLYCLVKRHISFIELILLLSFVISTYYLTYSRAGVGITIIMLLLVYFSQEFRFFGGLIFRFFTRFAFFIMFVLSYYIAKNFNVDNEFYLFINKLFSSRLYFSAEAINNLEITWFGQNILNHILEGLLIDNAYIYMLLSYGWFFTIVSIIILSFLNIIFVKMKLVREAIVLTMFSIYLAFEKVLLLYPYNFIFLLLSFLVYKENLNYYILSVKANVLNCAVSNKEC